MVVGARHLAEAWLDLMFEPCSVYRVGREHGGVVDFERTFLNSAGRTMLLMMGGDESVTSMLAEVPNVREQGLFDEYVKVAETGVPWTSLSQPYGDERWSVLIDLQVWRVPEGIALTYRDVTEQQALTQELRRSEERFRAIFDQLPEAISVMEAITDGDRVVDFRWEYVNALQAEMLGHPAERFVGHTLTEILPGAASEQFVQECAAVMETGEVWRRPEVWFDDIHLGGRPRRRAFDVRVSPVAGGVTVVSHDVTDLLARGGSGDSGPEAEPAG